MVTERTVARCFHFCCISVKMVGEYKDYLHITTAATTSTALYIIVRSVCRSVVAIRERKKKWPLCTTARGYGLEVWRGNWVSLIEFKPAWMGGWLDSCQRQWRQKRWRNSSSRRCRAVSLYIECLTHATTLFPWMILWFAESEQKIDRNSIGRKNVIQRRVMQGM